VKLSLERTCVLAALLERRVAQPKQRRQSLVFAEASRRREEDSAVQIESPECCSYHTRTVDPTLILPRRTTPEPLRLSLRKAAPPPPCWHATTSFPARSRRRTPRSAGEHPQAMEGTEKKSPSRFGGGSKSKRPRNLPDQLRILDGGDGLPDASTAHIGGQIR
jgi:hypothetical protein